MVTTSYGSGWVTFTTGTASSVLYGWQLNNNFWYVSSVINKGITGQNIAVGGIDAGNLIAANIITHSNLNFNTGGGCRVAQIGKAWTTTAGQFVAKGTQQITAANTTNTDVTIYFTNGDVCTTGEPVYKVAPHLYVTCVYATPTENPSIVVKAIATNSALINFDAYDTNTITENVTIKWLAMGDI